MRESDRQPLIRAKGSPQQKCDEDLTGWALRSHLNYQSYSRSAVRRLEIVPSERDSMQSITVALPVLGRNIDVDPSVGSAPGIRFKSASVPPGQRLASRRRSHLLSGMNLAPVPSGVCEVLSSPAVS